MSLLLAFCFGCVAGSLFIQYWGKLKPAVGRALAVVFGRQSAPAPIESPKQNAHSIDRLFSGFTMPFGIPWRLIGCVAIAALVLGSLYFYGQSKYAEGAADERALWQQQYMEAQNRARQAEYALDMDRLNRQQEAERLRVARETRLAQVREEIANAPDFETQYAAYLAHRDSLRAQSAARHAGARADYLSSLPSPT